jgi:hypothetical protein
MNSENRDVRCARKTCRDLPFSNGRWTQAIPYISVLGALWPDTHETLSDILRFASRAIGLALVDPLVRAESVFENPSIASPSRSSFPEYRNHQGSVRRLNFQ